MLGIVLVLCLVVLPESRNWAWLSLPLGVLFVFFVGGLALAVAAANAVFRDVEFVVAAALLPLFFLTPVLYGLDGLPVAQTHPWLLDLIHWANPLTPPILSIRAPLFYGELPAAGDFAYFVVETVAALVLGAVVFRRVDDRIAAEI
jgi:ABC-type polysaccharide/polyol phosphate export permease